MTKTADKAAAQLAKLDEKLGVGQGATRERAKLQRIIDGQRHKLRDQLVTEEKKTRRGKRGRKS